MLPKDRRIERDIFPKIGPAKFVRGKFTTISLFPCSGKSKFSFSISKKVAKTAVLRNKMRRAGYNTINQNLNKVKTGFLVRFSIFLIPQNPKELVEDINNLLIKNDLIL